MQQCQLGGKSRKIDGGRQREFTLLYILISAAKSNSQRPDSADRSQLHANFGKSHAYNTCDCPGLHLLRCVSQEQTSRDGWENVFRIQGQRSKRGNDGFLNPTVCQEILLMSFAQLALEWLFCAWPCFSQSFESGCHHTVMSRNRKRKGKEILTSFSFSLFREDSGSS